MEAMGLAPAFWEGRSVLVTGHTGFKGAWLCLWLQSLGARVTGYALPPPTQPSLFERASVKQGMASEIGDVRDYPALAGIIAKCRPEIVFHLAAQSLVRESYTHPVTTYATNVLGTVHLLDAVKNAGGVLSVISVTSDKCYENREWLWPYRESDTLGGHDPYSNSKACAELVTAAYRDSFFSAPASVTSIASARAGNVIGGGDWATDRLIPDLICAFKAGGPATIRSPNSIRPWQHVLEPLAGYLLLAQSAAGAPGSFAEAWNFGPTEQEIRSVGWVTEYVCRIWGAGAEWRHDGDVQPHEAGILRLDSSKARARLGWKPRWTLEQALEQTLDWYRRDTAGDDMRAFTLAQIERYMNG